MNLRFLKHPTTGAPDTMTTISVVVTIVCLIKFLFEGVEMTIAGHVLSLGRSDSMTYAALLGPVFGAQGWNERQIRSLGRTAPQQPSAQVDNPDGG